jgi:EAL domain-containing protein (putative c-di-GMP-specific phosphodiesterase class I)
VADRAFALAFQARRSLADHMVKGAEAQLRWLSRHHGVVQASVFLPIAAECGLTSAILAWMLDAACRTALDWPEGVISVPVPMASAQDGTLLTLVADALVKTGLSPGRLELAVAGTMAGGVDPDALLALAALRDLGLGVALKHLPLTTLKLDRSLLRDVPTDHAASSMVRATIDYAHALDITVVAAGVETEAQRGFLRLAGCDAALERASAAGPEPRTRQFPSPTPTVRPVLGELCATPS